MDINTATFFIAIFVALAPLVYTRFQTSANRARLDAAFRQIDTLREKTAEHATELKLLKARADALDKGIEEVKALLKAQAQCLHELDKKISSLVGNDA